MHGTSMAQALDRIRSEFLEMPGMRLTAPQVERLCGVDAALCRQVLSELVESRFLTHDVDGAYTRPTVDGMATVSRTGRRR